MPVNNTSIRRNRERQLCTGEDLTTVSLSQVGGDGDEDDEGQEEMGQSRKRERRTKTPPFRELNCWSLVRAL